MDSNSVTLCIDVLDYKVKEGVSKSGKEYKIQEVVASLGGTVCKIASDIDMSEHKGRTVEVVVSVNTGDFLAPRFKIQEVI